MKVGDPGDGYPRAMAEGDTASPPPLEVPEPRTADGVLAVSLGTVLWALGFVVLWATGARFGDDPDWLAVCVAGTLLGLMGLVFVTRRRAAYRAAGRSAAGQG